jgi:hypothetical protein
MNTDLHKCFNAETQRRGALTRGRVGERFRRDFSERVSGRTAHVFGGIVEKTCQVRHSRPSVRPKLGEGVDCKATGRRAFPLQKPLQSGNNKLRLQAEISQGTGGEGDYVWFRVAKQCQQSGQGRFGIRSKIFDGADGKDACVVARVGHYREQGGQTSWADSCERLHEQVTIVLSGGTIREPGKLRHCCRSGAAQNLERVGTSVGEPIFWVVDINRNPRVDCWRELNPFQQKGQRICTDLADRFSAFVPSRTIARTWSKSCGPETQRSPRVSRFIGTGGRKRKCQRQCHNEHQEDRDYLPLRAHGDSAEVFRRANKWTSRWIWARWRRHCGRL